ncbi:MAG TPA: prephenate dehydrogenase/arogenate dehydrogenase family protein [Bacteroidota bacterium]|nr:prephenate dehydrogenase/arogenate dehydrogenase family protein [Bacteroidota bacterium]
MKQLLALIGYGRFGRLAAHYLKDSFRVWVCDPRRSIRLESGLRRCTLLEASQCNTIILAVPISSMQSVLRKLSPVINPAALVIDVCSVKAEPIRWMKQLLPSTTSILGTHPLFGPDSASTTLQTKSIVLCPVRVPRRTFSPIASGLRKAGLLVSIMTPDHHDAAMARTLFLTQYLGRSLADLVLLPAFPLTENSHMLHRIVYTSMRDTRQLLNDMYHFNRYAKAIPARVHDALRRESLKLQSASRRLR